MKAFHDQPQEKTKVLEQLNAHYRADEIVKGQYWETGKGCAVGCTIHSSDHAAYELLFGIPTALAYLEDTIFENLPNERAKEWPIQFMSAIKVGADLSLVQYKFLHAILTDVTISPGIEHELVKDAVSGVAAIMLKLSQGVKVEEVLDELARSARSAAESARSAAESAGSAESAARSAALSARSAAESAAESAAWSALSAGSAESAESAWSAALSAWSAAESARSAWSAALSARSARSAESAWSAAESAAYVRMADLLLQFLSEAA